MRFWLGLEEDKPLPPAVELEGIFSNYLYGVSSAYYFPGLSGLGLLARGGLSTENQTLVCYADYRVQEYILGSGPSTVAVSYDGISVSASYELYKRSHAAGAYQGEPLQDEAEYARHLQMSVAVVEEALAGYVGGRESVVFLTPMGALGTVAVEAWQAVAQWDLQIADDGSVEAVRYATHERDPEYRQPLDELRSRIETAAAVDAFAGMRIASVDGLTAYYESIGAYDVIGPYNIPSSERVPFVPSKPPPPRQKPLAVSTASNSGSRRGSRRGSRCRPGVRRHQQRRRPDLRTRGKW